MFMGVSVCARDVYIYAGTKKWFTIDSNEIYNYSDLVDDN